MSKNDSMEISMKNFGLNVSVRTPSNIFFEIMREVPEMLDRIGFAKANFEYEQTLHELQDRLSDTSNGSINVSEDEVLLYAARCQVVTILGAILHGIPLLLRGDRLDYHFAALSNMDVSHLVQSDFDEIEVKVPTYH